MECARGIWFGKALCSSSYVPSGTTGATSIATHGNLSSSQIAFSSANDAGRQ